MNSAKDVVRRPQVYGYPISRPGADWLSAGGDQVETDHSLADVTGLLAVHPDTRDVAGSTATQWQAAIGRHVRQRRRAAIRALVLLVAFWAVVQTAHRLLRASPDYARVSWKKGDWLRVNMRVSGELRRDDLTWCLSPFSKRTNPSVRR